MPYEELQPLPNPDRAGWKIQTKEKPGWFTSGSFTDLKALFLKARNARMGMEVMYGHDSVEGFDRWVIREPNGGGSVIAPYAWIDGELYVGVIKQKRNLAGGIKTEVSRGASIPGESHEATAEREFGEETGARLGQRLKKLPGKPVNMNSTFFQANAGMGEGVGLFAVELRPEELVMKKEMHLKQVSSRTGNEHSLDATIYKLRPDLQDQIKEVNEKISAAGLRFIPASVLANTSDAFTLALMGRLLGRNNKKKTGVDSDWTGFR